MGFHEGERRGEPLERLDRGRGHGHPDRHRWPVQPRHRRGHPVSRCINAISPIEGFPGRCCIYGRCRHRSGTQSEPIKSARTDERVSHRPRSHLFPVRKRMLNTRLDSSPSGIPGKPTAGSRIGGERLDCGQIISRVGPNRELAGSAPALSESHPSRRTSGEGVTLAKTSQSRPTEVNASGDSPRV